MKNNLLKKILLAGVVGILLSGFNITHSEAIQTGIDIEVVTADATIKDVLEDEYISIETYKEYKKIMKKTEKAYMVSLSANEFTEKMTMDTIRKIEILPEHFNNEFYINNAELKS